MKMHLIVCFLLITTWCLTGHAQTNKVENQQSTDTSIKIFHLENADATECVRLLKQLDTDMTIVADSRTNSLIVESRDEERLGQLEAVLLKLDEQQSHPSQTVATTPDLKTRMRLPVEVAATEGLPDLPEVRTLLKKIADKESVAVRLAETIQKRKQTPDLDPGIIETRKNLETALTEALELKFQLERLQLAAMEERISRIKSHFEQRTKSIKLIVDRRARELIDGDDSRWTPKELSSAEAEIHSNRSAQVKQLPTSAPDSIDVVGAIPHRNTATPVELRSIRPITSYHQLASKLAEMSRQGVHSEVQHKERAPAFGGTAAESAMFGRRSIQDEYAATLKDLELRVAAGQAEFKAIEREKKRLEVLNANQLANQSEVDKVRDDFKQAQSGLERLQMILDLYQKAGESMQADLVGSKTGATRTDPPVQTKAVKEESSDANPNNFVRDGFPGDVASTTPNLPESYEQCAAVLRSSINVGELNNALTTIANLRNAGRVPTEQENASMASSILFFIAHSKWKLAPGLSQVFGTWNEFETPVKLGAILKALHGESEAEELAAVGYCSNLLGFFYEPAIPDLCKELLQLGESTNAELRNTALIALVRTLPITKLKSSEFKAAERQEMVSRMKTLVPRQKVIELLRNAVAEQEVAPALMIANLVAEHSKNIEDEDIIGKAIEVLFQIARGRYANSTASTNQRSAALQGLTQFQSRPKEIVPNLIELLKSDKSDLIIAGNWDFGTPQNSLSREAIISALAAFGQEASDALPLLEDELTLVKIKGQDGNAKKFLEQAIQKINGPPPVNSSELQRRRPSGSGVRTELAFAFHRDEGRYLRGPLFTARAFDDLDF